MAEDSLRSAVAWVMESAANAQRFRANADAIKELFPDLSNDEMSVMDRIREQSTKIEEMSGPGGIALPLNAGKAQTRSYGW